MSNRTHQNSHGRRHVFQELNAPRTDEERFESSQIELYAEANLELVS